MDRRLSEFSKLGYDKGMPKIVQALWFATLNLIFIKWWLPKYFRPILLRVFGASVGTGVLIRHNVRILWPWKLKIGDNTWLGEDVWILNLENVTIGRNVCLSQGVILCTGNHDFSSETFNYRNASINIDDGVWLAIKTLILPGVSIGRGATVLAQCKIDYNVKAYSLIKK